MHGYQSQALGGVDACPWISEDPFEVKWLSSCPGFGSRRIVDPTANIVTGMDEIRNRSSLSLMLMHAECMYRAGDERNLHQYERSIIHDDRMPFSSEPSATVYTTRSTPSASVVKIVAKSVLSAYVNPRWRKKLPAMRTECFLHPLNRWPWKLWPA